MHCQATHFLSSAVGVRLHMCVACVQNGLMTLFHESSVEPGVISCAGMCRKGRFMKHLVSWMSEPKCNDIIREKWYDIWSKADAGFGAELRSEVESSKSETHVLTGAGMA